jgi:penicillin G amidase
MPAPVDAPEANDPPPPRRRRRRLRIALVTVLVLALAAAGSLTGYGFWAVHRSFPQVSGTLEVAGLRQPVDVLRDRWGVPQVYASSSHDLFFAQGYVHAQDRFWEMDVRRHITAGRLAEMLGPGAVETDEVVRTLGWRRVAEQELALLSPETLAHLRAYSDGVNAYLGGRTGVALSVEYGILRFVASDYRPQPWTPADSVAWLKAMAWNLNSGISGAVQRSLLAGRLPAAMVAEIFPPYDYAGQPTIVPDDARPGVRPAAAPGKWSGPPGAALTPLAGLTGVEEKLTSVLGAAGAGIGSNSWVVAGSRTASGKPLLANDPHLAPSVPGIWYQVGLHCTRTGPGCPYDVAGFGFSGMPGVVIGHNADIAWGLTNLGADDSDLFLEKVRGDTYEYKGARRPLVTRTETIEVAGADARTITVRSTVHGPLLSDVDDDVREAGDRGGYAVALSWTALTPARTMDALFGLDEATDWPSFRAAAARFASPSQNMVYADRAGHIGYQAPGLIPVRRSGADGLTPLPGWTGEHDWTGFLPFAELPSVLDPPQGFLVTANNAVVGPDHPDLLTAEWGDGYRAARITALLRGSGRLDTAAMQRIQTDTMNPNASTLVPYLLGVTPGEAARRAQDLLRGWDGTQPPDSAPAAYFNAVWRHLLRLTFTDELSATPATLRPDGGGRWFQVVSGLLRRPTDPWWRNAGDGRGLRTRDDVLRAALDDAATELDDRLGGDPARWRWGDLHTLTLREPTLGTSGPGPVRWLLDSGPYELGGGSAAVDATGWNANRGYEVNWGPSMRMVVDLADLDASRWINQSGASGHARHPHHTDQTPLWARGGTTEWPFGRAAVDAATADRLTLRPG